MQKIINLFDFKQKVNYKTEILSGLTVALALVPEAVAFALIAGVGPLVGLYAAFMMGLVTSILGGRPGMISGALWTLKGSIVGLLSHYLKLRQMPNLSVTPHFQFVILQTRLTCIFQLRIGHAILAGLKLLKFWKGGRPNLHSKNASNTKEQSKSV